MTRAAKVSGPDTFLQKPAKKKLKIKGDAKLDPFPVHAPLSNLQPQKCLQKQVQREYNLAKKKGPESAF